MSDNRYLTTRQVAAVLGVSLGTVQQMVESGALQAWKTAGGHRRILATSVDSYLARTHPVTRADNPERPLDLMIVEEDAAERQRYQETIGRWEFPLRLRLVDNGFDALLEIGKSVPEILIANPAMPAMDGFAFLRHLRRDAELGKMDIIVVSALDSAAYEEAGGLPAGVAAYSKPIPFHELKGFAQARLTARQRP